MQRPLASSSAFTASFAGQMYSDNSLSTSTHKKEKIQHQKKLREKNTMEADGSIVRRISKSTDEPVDVDTLQSPPAEIENKNEDNNTNTPHLHSSKKSESPPRSAAAESSRVAVRPTTASQLQHRARPSSAPMKPWQPTGNKQASHALNITKQERLVKKVCKYCHSQYYVREQVRAKSNRRRTKRSKGRRSHKREEDENAQNARAAIEWAQSRQAAISKAKRIRNLRSMGYEVSTAPQRLSPRSPMLGNVSEIPSPRQQLELQARRPLTARPRARSSREKQKASHHVENVLALYSPQVSPEPKNRRRPMTARGSPGVERGPPLRVRVPTKPKQQRPQRSRPATAHQHARRLLVGQGANRKPGSLSGGANGERPSSPGNRGNGKPSSPGLPRPTEEPINSEDDVFAISEDEDELPQSDPNGGKEAAVSVPKLPERSMTEFESIGGETMTSEAVEDEWKCTACNFGNALEAEQCVICGAKCPSRDKVEDEYDDQDFE